MYKRADLIVCQSKAMLEDLRDRFSVPASKMIQIYNPVDIGAIRDKADDADNPFRGENGTNLIAIGRLSPEKGFDRLIEAFPKLLAIRPEARLWLIGTGAGEAQLVELRDRLGLQERVFFAGFQDNPFAWLKHADLFVLSSHYEGLPNALLEAIALGCPVLTLEHPGGTEEIMRLTLQRDRMIPQFVWKEEWFAKPDERASERLQSKFGLQSVIGQYSDIL
jgi:glycosyltransferase involved in cell wall biosynthesis